MTNLDHIMLTSSEVADLLRMKVRTVQHLARAGQLPGARRTGKQWRFLTSEILKYIEDPTPWQLSTNVPGQKTYGSDIGTVRKKYDALLARRTPTWQQRNSRAA